jgi:hypothetical protein
MFNQQTHFAALTAGQFQSHHDVGYHQSVLEEQAFYGAVASRPIEAIEWDVRDSSEMSSAARSKTVRDGS